MAMMKLILIAGGIALTATPAYAGQPAPTGGTSGGTLSCLTCGLLSSGGNNGGIVSGNLTANAKANVAARAMGNGNANANANAALKVSAHVGKSGNSGNSGNTALSVALKAKANLPSVNLGGGDCN
jgi:hypothetical protein